MSSDAAPIETPEAKEKRRINTIAVLVKKQENIERKATPVQVTIANWVAKISPVPPNLSELETAHKHLLERMKQHEDVETDLYLYSHGAEFTTDHEDRCDKLTKSLIKHINLVAELVRNQTVATAPPKASTFSLVSSQARENQAPFLLREV
jgi:hypothetical protein